MLAVQEIESLIARVKRGESSAFSSLIRVHLRAAYLTALAIVGDPSDAEDVVQDAFVKAFERLESCREPRRFSGWLLRIVRNHAINWSKHRRFCEIGTRNVARVSENYPPKIADLKLRKRLIDSLAHLTPIEKEVVLLHDLEEWKHAEIGEALDISELMCRQHLFAARKKLRAQLNMEISQEVKKNGK